MINQKDLIANNIYAAYADTHITPVQILHILIQSLHSAHFFGAAKITNLR